MSDDKVLVSTVGAVGTITWNTPDRLNAVTPAMLSSAREGLAALMADRSIKVIAIAGAGRGFCSGADLGPSGDVNDVDPDTLTAGADFVRDLVACPVPTVALVQGVAAGMGVPIALACDYVLASEAASFVLAFARIGLMPDGGATALVAASIGRARAMRIALTGEKLSAQDAVAWGMIAECVAAEQFSERAEAVVQTFASTAPDGAALTKAAINAATLDLEPALAREEAGQLRLFRNPDFAEGVAAFGARRPARFGVRSDDL